MARLRRASQITAPHAESQIFMNQELYGSNERGGHHLPPLDEACPVPWVLRFGRSAPLGLEIGFNRGRFLEALARENPAEDFVGIEIRRKFAWDLAGRMEAAGDLSNLRLIWGDAKQLVSRIFPPEILQNIYVTFPDPWWKKRHEKRRLVGERFAETLATCLRPGGSVWVKSDVPMISEEIGEALQSRSELCAPVDFGENDLPLTHRERSCIAQELPIYRHRYQKR